MSKTSDVRRRHRVGEFGSGPTTFLFGHGLGADQGCWHRLLRVLAPHNRCVVFDHSGTDDRPTARGFRDDSMETHAEHVLAIADCLGLERFTYVGHGFGGMIGVVAALLAPHRCERLVLIDASPRLVDDNSYSGSLTPAEMEEFLALLERNQFVAEVPHESGKRPTLGVGRHLASTFARYDARAILEQVTVPALILHCMDDHAVPLEAARFLHAHLRQSALVHLPISGHHPHLTHPETIAAAILDPTLFAQSHA